MSSDELVYMTATEMASKIRQKELSAREVMQAHLAQIARVNPKVNAIVTKISDDEALALADAADERMARGDEVGVLHGLPIAHKDLEDTAGMRTTYGSPIFADNVPAKDTLMIQRLKGAGALTIGKTNVPEWGAGSQTFNPVFGPTFNPYDTTKTCGGSRGGAAVTLACGMAPVADGSDMGGSLRNPGNFNNIVGFRPSPGRVPVSGSSMPWSPLGVKGPMARTVADVALMLSTIAGYDRSVQLAIEEPGDIFRRPLDRDFKGVRIAFSADFGGLPVDPRVRDVLEAGRPVFEGLGCAVEEAAPDFSGADDAFRDLRAFSFATQHVDLMKAHRDMYKDTVIWNAEEGFKLSAVDVGKAMAKQSAVYNQAAAFMEDYEFLIGPVNQVPPFDVNTPYPTEINGVEMETYLAWMKSAYYVTVTGLPAISVPCGFTPEGLPVGIQIVGRRHDDFGVLQLAHAFEQATGVWKRRPPVVDE